MQASDRLERVVGVVQARSASGRLPRKVLQEFGGVPLVVHIARRVRAFKGIDDVVVATTREASDDDLARTCDEYGLSCHRGPVDDLAERLLGAAHDRAAEAIVRVWSDCPFVAPEAAEAGLKLLRDGAAVVTTAGEPRTWPSGADLEIWRVEVLEALMRETTDPRLREFPIEFVTDKANRFRLERLRWTIDASQLVLTIDYPEDLTAARAVLTALHEDNRAHATMGEVVDLLIAKPRLAQAFANAPRNIEYMQYLASRAANLRAD